MAFLPAALARRITPVSILALALAGCASAPAVNSLPPASRLVVLQFPSAVTEDELDLVLHPDEEKVPVTVLAQDRQDIEQSIQTDLASALAQSPVAPFSTATFFPVGSAWPDMRVGMPADAVQLADLRARQPADAYLRFRVTDYGRTPKAWKSAYISFEVVSTLAIGGLLYIHKTTRPLAGLYLLQEGVEEYSEGYAGWWLLNRLSRPIRIEADLIDGRSGALLWEDRVTGMAPWRSHNVWRMSAATRNQLLQVSTQRVIRELVTALGAEPAAAP